MRPPNRALVLAALVFGTGSLACSSGPLQSEGGSATDGGGAGAPAAGGGGGGGSSIGGTRADGAAGAQAPMGKAGAGGSPTGLAGAGGAGGFAGAGGASMTGSGGSGGTTGTGGAAAPPVCPGLSCALPSCPFGVKKAPSGHCYTCECNPAPTCTNICDFFCQNGYVSAGDGCPICACNPPPATPCEVQCGPPPAVPHGLCEDHVHTAGISCVMDPKTGVCAWQVQVCPPTCLPSVDCVGPNYWDPNLCKCLPAYCPCSSAQLCFKAMGPPGVPTGLPPQCGTPLPNCSAADKCTCLYGNCHAGTDPAVACVCQIQ